MVATTHRAGPAARPLLNQQGQGRTHRSNRLPHAVGDRTDTLPPDVAVSLRPDSKGLAHGLWMLAISGDDAAANGGEALPLE